MEINDNEEQSYGSFYAEDKISKNTQLHNKFNNSEFIPIDSNNDNKENETSVKEINHSIIELHDKIKNEVTPPESPKEKNDNQSIQEENSNKEESQRKKKVVFKNTNSFKSVAKSIKTETDIKEEISKGSEEEKEPIVKQTNYLPTSVISSFKLEKLKEQKEKLNLSFKVNSHNNSKSSDKKTTPSLVNLTTSLIKPPPHKKKQLLLPRISSANNITKKTNFIMKPNNNIIPLPQKVSNVNKRINTAAPMKPPVYTVDKELRSLEKENFALIKELQILNSTLSDLLVKKIPLTVPREKQINKERLRLGRHHKTQSEDINNEREKNSYKKYLNSLINEYNSLYKIYLSASEPERKDELEKKLETIENEYKDNKKENDELKRKIIKNEIYLNKAEQEEMSYIKNIEFLNAKYDLYKLRIEKKKKEIERMSQLVDKENERISVIREKFDKLTEILKNYEETPDSLNNKIEEDNNEKLQKEKYENLLKKQKIISHSRLSMQKSYAQEIDKQKKYIEQLNNTIKEVDNVLSNLNS